MVKMKNTALSVQKVGGSCLSNKSSMEQLKKLLNNNSTVLVVSAFDSVTDNLQQCIDLSVSGNREHKILNEIFKFHVVIIDSFASVDKRVELISEIKKDLNQIEKLLKSISIIGSITENYSDYILSFGEKWSALIIHSFLQSNKIKSKYIHTKDFLIVQKSQSIPHVDWSISRKLLNDLMPNENFDCIVLTGFIASDRNGNIVTLGRNGSDFSASIIAKLLHSNNLIFWKDVDSILSADPNIVKSAFSLEKLSYEEAMEMAHFGSSILHAKSIFPAAELDIPISVKSFLHPEKKGTIISGENDKNRIVKAVTHISGLSLITIDGNGMKASTLLMKRLFSHLNELDIHIYLTTQSSSEYSVCFAVKTVNKEYVLSSLNNYFKTDFVTKDVKKVSSIDGFALVAIIGDNMIGIPGIVANCTRLLGNANINIHAFAQGASERNISIVIQEKNLVQAIKLVHSTLVSKEKLIEVLILGKGLIGAELLKMLEWRKEEFI